MQLERLAPVWNKLSHGTKQKGHFAILSHWKRGGGPETLNSQPATIVRGPPRAGPNGSAKSQQEALESSHQLQLPPVIYH